MGVRDFLAAFAIVCCACAAGQGAEPASAPRDLEQVWVDLDGPNVSGAIDEMVAAGPKAVALLRQKLLVGDDDQVARLIKQLDDDNWRTRESAGKALRELAPLHEARLRKVARETTSFEVRARLEAILSGIGKSAPHVPDVERGRMGAIALDRIGTPEALAVLRQAAKGAVFDAIRQEAAILLDRRAESALKDLLGAVQQDLRRGDTAHARKVLDQAKKLAGDSAMRQADVSQWIGHVDSALAVVAASEKVLAVNGQDRAARDRLVRACVVDLDNPSAAGKYLAGTTDDDLVRVVRLAALDASKASAADMLNAARAYMALADGARWPARQLMQARAIEAYKSFLAKATTDDPSRAKAVAAVKELGESLGRRTMTINPGGVSMTLVYVPPGEFLMGSPPSEVGREAQVEQQHKVCLTHGFYMGQFDVTVGQFAAFVKDTGYKTAAEKENWAYVDNSFRQAERTPGANWKNPGYEQKDDFPVVCVNWQDASEFCAWAGRKTGMVVRLPFDAEWEYACRAGARTAYPWGNDPDGGEGLCNIRDQTVKKNHPEAQACGLWSDGYLYASPGGAFKPNAWGLYDMLGNVWQWCYDGYGPLGAADAADPVVPASSGAVIRGAGWNCGAVRCAFRGNGAPPNRHNTIGFRVVVEPDGRHIDMLKLIDAKKDVVAGGWTVTKDGLNYAGGANDNRIRFPYLPPEEYDVVTEFTRTSGGEAVTHILSAGGTGCQWCLGAWGNSIFGWELVDGQHVGTPNRTTVHAGLTNNQRYISRVQVRRHAIFAYLDGKLVSCLNTNFKDLSQPANWSIGEGRIGLGTGTSPYTFHRIEVIEHGAEGKVTSAATAPSPKD